MFPTIFFQEESSNRRKTKHPKKRWFFTFLKNAFFDPPYSFRKREEESEKKILSGPPEKKLLHSLSDSDTDRHPPPPNSPLPADEQNIKNILNFNDPHRNLSYIIEACVQKNSKIWGFCPKNGRREGRVSFQKPPIFYNILSANLFLIFFQFSFHIDIQCSME